MKHFFLVRLIPGIKDCGSGRQRCRMFLKHPRTQSESSLLSGWKRAHAAWSNMSTARTGTLYHGSKDGCLKAQGRLLVEMLQYYEPMHRCVFKFKTMENMVILTCHASNFLLEISACIKKGNYGVASTQT